MKAAVLYEVNKPLVIEDVSLQKPGPREVLIRTSVAGLDVGDVRPDFFNDAGGFVTEHRGQRMRIQPFHEVQVGVTEAGDAGADQDFARSGIRYADILDLQRLVDFEQYGGLHQILPLFYVS